MTLPPAIHLDVPRAMPRYVRACRWAACGARGLRIIKTTDARAVTCVNCVKRARRAKGG